MVVADGYTALFNDWAVSFASVGLCVVWWNRSSNCKAVLSMVEGWNSAI